jgi:hypothetical protein
MANLLADGGSSDPYAPDSEFDGDAEGVVEAGAGEAEAGDAPPPPPIVKSIQDS